MDERTWTVVKFTDENTVEAVPTTWLVGSSCYWPPYPREKLMAAIRNFEGPNTHWPSHKMEVFRNGTFETYLEARKKLNVAEYTSDLNQEDEQNTRKSRHQKIIDTSSEDESHEVHKKKSLPEPPTRTVDNSSQNNGNDITAVAANNETIICCCCPTHKKMLRTDDEILKIKKQYVFITNILANMKTDLSNIIAMTSEKTHPMTEESIFSKFSFPVNDETALEEIENYLKIEENFQKAVTELANLGGDTMYDFIKRAMQVLITNGFGVKYSFLGRKKKSSFSILRISNLVIKAAQHANKGDQKEAEEAISKWLRRANERK